MLDEQRVLLRGPRPQGWGRCVVRLTPPTLARPTDQAVGVVGFVVVGFVVIVEEPDFD